MSLLSLGVSCLVWFDNDQKWKLTNAGRLSLESVDYALIHKVPFNGSNHLDTAKVQFSRIVADAMNPEDVRWEVTGGYLLAEKSSGRELSIPSGRFPLTLEDAESDRLVAAQKQGVPLDQIEIKRLRIVVAKFKNSGKSRIQDLRIWHNGYGLDRSNVWRRLRVDSVASAAAMYFGDLEPEGELTYQIRALGGKDDGFPSRFVTRHVATYRTESGTTLTNEFYRQSDLLGSRDDDRFRSIPGEAMRPIISKSQAQSP